MKQEAVNYNEYHFTEKELIRYEGELLLGLAVLSYIFYNSLIPVLFFFFPMSWFYLKARRKSCIENRKRRLKHEFLTGVTLLGDYLRSGYAIENALSNSLQELTEVWGESSDIVREWKYMAAQLQISRPIESVWSDFGKRSCIEEINNFSEIFAIVKRSGGQLSSIVTRCAGQLSKTFSAEEQIQNSIAAKKYEQKIMNIMPMAILAYIRITSPDFIAILYEGLLGRCIMSLCLVLYACAYIWSKRIMDIMV